MLRRLHDAGTCSLMGSPPEHPRRRGQPVDLLAQVGRAHFEADGNRRRRVSTAWAAPRTQTTRRRPSGRHVGVPPIAEVELAGPVGEAPRQQVVDEPAPPRGRSAPSGIRPAPSAHRHRANLLPAAEHRAGETVAAGAPPHRAKARLAPRTPEKTTRQGRHPQVRLYPSPADAGGPQSVVDSWRTRIANVTCGLVGP